MSEEPDTNNIVLSVFQNYITNGLAAENIENEIIPCAFSTVEALMDQACNIEKYVKKQHPKLKLFWIAPAAVGYYSEEDRKKEEDERKKKRRKREKKKRKNWN